MREQLIGLATGVVFGFLLQKSRVLRFEKQISFLLLKDMTILKVMLSAVIVGMIGIYFFKDVGIAITFKHKAMNLGAVLIGSLLFGCGWALGGFCPGTSLGALGEGRFHALWVILGMLSGAALFAEVYPLLKKSVLSWKNWGNISLMDVTGLNHWVIISILVIIFVLILFAIKNKA
ncbi:MAG: YeeE/YedE family protein [Candidatus Omnitrophica bacterium]|nr:YeeE/YedE family protein [Candidatus Omnitrophota bacterium]